ncbi:MAG: BolA family transcriptional regulator [Proteobacteria bacterium]|nr:MAG: BolA family transcriptional regulator [Pseudomonadota bacterium]QKK12497.1 MAG: BolA family transcriptional regulator [Pseudomonadota bacterium]
MSARVDSIRARLTASFSPEHLEIVDESHKHAGHAGARDGRGHFAITIVSSAFTGMPPIKRHRAIYQALGELMQSDIHALSIQAGSPDE